MDFRRSTVGFFGTYPVPFDPYFWISMRCTGTTSRFALEKVEFGSIRNDASIHPALDFQCAQLKPGLPAGDNLTSTTFRP